MANFNEELKAANSVAIEKYRTIEEKELGNLKYVTLIRNLVLLFVKVYNYKTGNFEYNNIKDAIKPMVGTPDEIEAYIDENTGVATLSFHYPREVPNLKMVGVPDFFEDEKINFKDINDCLETDGIKFTSNLWDGGQYGTDCYYVEFDATLLIETRKRLLEETAEKIRNYGKK